MLASSRRALTSPATVWVKTGEVPGRCMAAGTVSWTEGPGGQGPLQILFVWLTVTVKEMIVSVLLALIDKDNRNKPCPAGEGGPQRKKNANTWSDFLTRLRWMRCITRTLFHIFANAKGAEFE